eukprot:comp19241_c0_seq1/m.22016 comp19241_c0_seq1/g.22016  ORF comp19241_c0_seq1/g.22016 comp19241_c0_seq1/m.22016 type:complete len:206 (-) comp19241_c0_seq1:741-1358(-)
MAAVVTENYAPPKVAEVEPKRGERLGGNFIAVVSQLSDTISITTGGSLTYPEEHEAIGYIVHSGKRTGIGKKRALVFDRPNRQLLLFNQAQVLKATIPLAKVKLLKRITFGSSEIPAMELVWAQGSYTVFVEGTSSNLAKWYGDLQRERVAAVGEEEDKTKDKPKYLRGNGPASPPKKSNRRASDPGYATSSVKTALHNVFSWNH